VARVVVARAAGAEDVPAAVVARVVAEAEGDSLSSQSQRASLRAAPFFCTTTTTTTAKLPATRSTLPASG
jgi:hypothetical protein